MDIKYHLYNLLLPVAGAAARCAAPFNEKIAEGMNGRKNFRTSWAEAAASIKRDRPLIWFHVSSVGEFLQARPVMDLLAERSGGAVELALTFFSPSGMNYYHKFDRTRRNPSVRFVDYLPIDTRRNVRFCLETLDPSGIVYVKFDLWPNLIVEAANRNIPQILVSGTLSPDSRRLSRLARSFYGDIYPKLTAIAAISDEDAQRFLECTRGTGHVVTAGDTRFDQVCKRVDMSIVKPPGSLAGDERTFVIAGSTWPRDEAVVIPGFRKVLETHPSTCLILVPHEPTPGRLSEITRLLGNEQLGFILLSELGDSGAGDIPVIVADGVGYLAELYRAGNIAYVGGSFTTGVHNVMEPAVLGLPVLFGPRIDNSYEARKLVGLDAGAVVHTPEDFAGEVCEMLARPDSREHRGRTGSSFIRNNCGAAQRCADLIETHILKKGTQ